MTTSDRIAIGIVGVCGGYGRGRMLAEVLQRNPAVHVRALCDIDRDGLLAANQSLGVDELYFDYNQMLDQSRLDAVVIATPMNLHVPQSIAALQRGLHVLCEVTAAVNVDECRDLVAACNASSAVYMMAENLNYSRQVVAVREYVRRGAFGIPYYAEGGFIADAKGLAELTPWRRRWQLGVNGNPYITHNLGPILQWLPGDRITSLCCTGAGTRYQDPRGDTYESEATCTMLCRTAKGNQIVIRSDFLSNRPGTGAYNDLQGTDGCYLSPRIPDEPHRIWLKSRSETRAWENLDDIADEVLPPIWHNAVPDGPAGAYDGMMLADFVDTVRQRIPNPIDIHEAMDQTLPGLISQLSIANGGAWLDVPDSRTW